MEGKKWCPKCNTEVSVDENFCYRCGYAFKNERDVEADKEIVDNKAEGFLKDGKRKGLVALLIVVIIVAVGYLGYSNYRKQQVQSYLTEAYAYVMEIEETTIDLNYVNEAWDITEAGSWLYYGTVKSYAKTMFSLNIDRAKDAFESIEDHYDTLQKMDANGSTMQEIKKKVEDLHLAYETAYSMIILFEKGNNSSEISELKTITSEFKTTIEDVADEWKITIDKEDEGDNQEI